jgi:hypothetical protein
MNKQSNSIIRVSEEVRDTLASGGAVVAHVRRGQSRLLLPGCLVPQGKAAKTPGKLANSASLPRDWKRSNKICNELKVGVQGQSPA